jgi:integrase
MPKLVQSVPKYRLHKASRQAVVTLNGSDVYLGPHGTKTSRLEYDRVVAEWLANGRAPASRSCAACAVEQLLAAFWLFAKSYYTRPDGSLTKELDAYRQAMKPVRALYGHTPVVDFGAVALKTVRQALIDRGLSRSHVNHQVNRIRRIFKWGVENELVPPGIIEGLKAVAGLKRGKSAARESDPVLPVPDEHVDAVKPHTAPQVWAMVELQRLTGMRSGEVTTMRGCDISMTGEVWEYGPADHKMSYCGRNRVVYLGPRARAIVRPFLKADLQAYLFSPKDAEEARNAARRASRRSPMTPSQARRQRKPRPKRQAGERYNSDSYARALKYAIEQAGVPHWHPHQLRHNAATRLRGEFGLDAAQIILGHASANVTQIYAQADRERAKQIMVNVG